MKGAAPSRETIEDAVASGARVDWRIFPNLRVPTVVVHPESPDEQVIARAAAVLRAGGLVAFPTETVYGLGANALDAAAVRRIFEAKERPSFNPLIVHVHDVQAAGRLVSAWPEAADRLARRFWPGPLTLVLPRRPVVPDIVTAGLDTVALRVPAHPVALALVRAADLPVAAPSANRFTQLSPTRAEHVVRSLGPRVDFVLDAGPTTVGIESTVLDLSGAAPEILRPGIITADAIAAEIGPVRVAAHTALGSAPRRSPGMVDRHYAPRALVVLFDPGGHDAALAAASAAAGRGQVVGALAFEPLGAPVHHAIVMPRAPGDYARELYAALHALDELGCDVVLVERVPSGEEWAGVRDRLERAGTS